MRVADVMTREVKTVSPRTSVGEIVKTLLQQRISAVPVVGADGQLVGMVSEADLLHRPEVDARARRPWWIDIFSDPDSRAAEFLKAHGRTAQEVMSTRLEVVQEETPVAVAARLMEERRVKRLPVLADGQLVGIVSRSDLLRLLVTRADQPEAEMVDDRAIENRFLQTVRDQGLEGADLVTAVVEEGVVHLWGVAATMRVRQALEVAAAEIPGVRSIDNCLAVREAMSKAS